MPFYIIVKHLFMFAENVLFAKSFKRVVRIISGIYILMKNRFPAIYWQIYDLSLLSRFVELFSVWAIWDMPRILNEQRRKLLEVWNEYLKPQSRHILIGW